MVWITVLMQRTIYCIKSTQKSSAHSRNVEFMAVFSTIQINDLKTIFIFMSNKVFYIFLLFFQEEDSYRKTLIDRVKMYTLCIK